MFALIQAPVPGVTGTAYVANDEVGTPVTLALPRSGQAALLHSLALVDPDNQKVAADVFLFDELPTGAGDKNAHDLAASEEGKYIGHVSLAASDYKGGTACAVATKGALGIVVNPKKVDSLLAAEAIYALVVTRGTPTYTPGQLTLKLGVEQ